jgi:hypothetical protein
MYRISIMVIYTFSMPSLDRLDCRAWIMLGQFPVDFNIYIVWNQVGVSDQVTWLRSGLVTGWYFACGLFLLKVKSGQLARAWCHAALHGFF